LVANVVVVCGVVDDVVFTVVVVEPDVEDAVPDERSMRKVDAMKRTTIISTVPMAGW
jgi:hypothetical protein